MTIQNRAHFVAFLQDSTGIALASATVTVRQETTATPITETIYSDDTSATTLANPLTADSAGKIEFYLTAPKRVDLLISKSGYTDRTITVDVLFTTPANLTVQDEGSALPARAIIDFAGAGITATDDAANSRTLVTADGIPPDGSVTTAKLANDAATYAKMQNVSAASRLLGRGSAAGSGDPEELTIGSGLTLSGTALSTTAALFVRKTADETVTSSTVLQDDDELTLAVAINSAYEITLVLHYRALDGVTDMKLNFGAPASSAVRWGGIVYGVGSSTAVRQASATTADLVIGGANVDLTVTIRGTLRTAGTSGNFKIQWAQNTSSANALRLYTDSYLLLNKVA